MRWFRTTVPNPLNVPKPLVVTHTGFISAAEAPGANTTAKTMIVKVNGVEKYNNTGANDSAPRTSFCIGNPSYQNVGAQWNASPGDVLDIGIQSDGGWIGDFASPNRY